MKSVVVLFLSVLFEFFEYMSLWCFNLSCLATEKKRNNVLCMKIKGVCLILLDDHFRQLQRTAKFKNFIKI